MAQQYDKPNYTLAIINIILAIINLLITFTLYRFWWVNLISAVIGVGVAMYMWNNRE